MKNHLSLIKRPYSHYRQAMFARCEGNIKSDLMSRLTQLIGLVVHFECLLLFQPTHSVSIKIGITTAVTFSRYRISRWRVCDTVRSVTFYYQEIYTFQAFGYKHLFKILWRGIFYFYDYYVYFPTLKIVPVHEERINRSLFLSIFHLVATLEQ